MSETWRDMQRARVYRAQLQLQHHRQDRAQFPDLAAVEAYIVKACSRKRIQDAYPRAIEVARGVSGGRLTLKDGGGTSNAYARWTSFEGAVINLPLWSRNELVILHELAHAIVPDRQSRQAHGWEFCAGFLTLVLHVRGREEHDKLKAAFKANRVRFTKPRAKVPMSDANREAAIVRLRAYHAAKAAAKQGGEA